MKLNACELVNNKTSKELATSITTKAELEIRLKQSEEAFLKESTRVHEISNKLNVAETETKRINDSKNLEIISISEKLEESDCKVSIYMSENEELNENLARQRQMYYRKKENWKTLNRNFRQQQDSGK